MREVPGCVADSASLHDADRVAARRLGAGRRQAGRGAGRSRRRRRRRATTRMAQAKQHFETGRNAYNAGDYVTAIREFKAAEALRPSPILAYNIGLANEKLGKRRVAREVLQALPRAAAQRAEQGRGRRQGRGARGGDRGRSRRPAPGAATGQPPPPPARTEQPGDMPPADPKRGRRSQPGYDPYASTAPPGQPVRRTSRPRRRATGGLASSSAAP